MRPGSRGFALAFLPAILVLSGGCERGPDPTYHRSTCMNNLYLLDFLLREARAAGALEPCEGRRFLTQLESRIAVDSDLRVFCCPFDPDAPPERQDRRALHCSYSGPTAAAARRFIRGEAGLPFVLACDGFGEGRREIEFQSVIVLWNTGRVESVPRDEVFGYGVPGFRHGPGCPDLRFRGLAW